MGFIELLFAMVAVPDSYLNVLATEVERFNSLMTKS